MIRTMNTNLFPEKIIHEA